MPAAGSSPGTGPPVPGALRGGSAAGGPSYRGRVPVDPVLRPVGCPSGRAVHTELVPVLAAALDGSGPAVVPVPDGGPGRRVLEMAAVHEPLERPAGDGDPVVLVVPTSGSTGAPRGALLTRSALAASGAATADRLGGPGRWLLALPTTHVAGLQVLVRSLAAGLTPVCQDLAGGFDVGEFTAAAAAMPGRTRRYTSLVPTQLARVLADVAATTALRGFDAVLLGGAAASADLLERAGAAGARVVTTYGMSETCGGCVYDDVPLDPVLAAVRADGRIVLGGAVLFSGYRRDRVATATVLSEGSFLTGDLGRIRSDGRLQVLGRADEVVVSGGENVSPEAVERVLTADPSVTGAVVVGLPDAEWGRRIVALVTAPDGLPDPDRVAAAVRAELGRAAVPRALLVVGDLPALGIGKPDRRAAERLAAELTAP